PRDTINDPGVPGPVPDDPAFGACGDIVMLCGLLPELAVACVMPGAVVALFQVRILPVEAILITPLEPVKDTTLFASAIPITSPIIEIVSLVGTNSNKLSAFFQVNT